MREYVTGARETVYVGVHVANEVNVKEKMCLHTAEDAGSSAEKEDCPLCRKKQNKKRNR